MTTSTTINYERVARKATALHKQARFWDRVADNYAKKPIANEDAYQHKLAKTRAYLRADSTVLEVGCGTGGTALEHAPLVQQYTATDVSRRMIELAQDKAPASKMANLSFVRIGVADALDSGQSYDAVLALNLLHLLPDWRAVIGKAHRALEPGGVFITSTLCLAEQFAWLSYVAPIGRILGLMPELANFRSGDLKSAMQLDGFGIEYEWQADARNGLFLIGRKL